MVQNYATQNMQGNAADFETETSLQQEHKRGGITCDYKLEGDVGLLQHGLHLILEDLHGPPWPTMGVHQHQESPPGWWFTPFNICKAQVW